MSNNAAAEPRVFFRPWRFVWWVVGASFVLTVALFASGERRAFVIGETSVGHLLVEAKCEACHEPFGGISQARCIGCHEAELVNDVHPAERIFAKTERWEKELAVLDARSCVACHLEHRPGSGFTERKAMCVLCHESTLTDVPSHKGFNRNTCMSCHNYHFEEPISLANASDHVDDPDLLDARPLRLSRTSTGPAHALAPDAPAGVVTPAIEGVWRSSAHAQRGVNCTGCHAESGRWVTKRGDRACEGCHKVEVASFFAGKHGARTSLGLDPVSPNHGAVRRKMVKSDVSQRCAACHDVHGRDGPEVEVDVCLKCHADRHSKNYLTSPHGKLYVAGRLDVPTCSTCHLVVDETEEAPPLPAKRIVSHNNSLTMSPRERMLEVCLECHGLAYSWSALRNRNEVQTNFSDPVEPPSSVTEYMSMIRAATAAERGADGPPPSEDPHVEEGKPSPEEPSPNGEED